MLIDYNGTKHWQDEDGIHTLRNGKKYGLIVPSEKYLERIKNLEDNMKRTKQKEFDDIEISGYDVLNHLVNAGVITAVNIPQPLRDKYFDKVILENELNNL